MSRRDFQESDTTYTQQFIDELFEREFPPNPSPPPANVQNVGAFKRTNPGELTLLEKWRNGNIHFGLTAPTDANAWDLWIEVDDTPNVGSDVWRVATAVHVYIPEDGT